MYEFNEKEWRKNQDDSNIKFLTERTNMSKEKAEIFYKEFVRDQMFYHYPEDSETLATIIKTYNYLNK